MKNMLVISGEEECSIAAKRASDSEAELVLGAAGFDVQCRIGRVKDAVTQVVEPGAVELVGAGFRQHVDYCAASPTGFGRNRIGGHPEFLDHLVGELIRSAVPPPGLGKEGIIVVRPIYKVTGREAANSADRKASVQGQNPATPGPGERPG